MSRKIHTLNIEKILYRIGQVIGTQKKKTIAETLGTTSQGYKNWRDRNTIPWAELFEFSQKNNTSLEWLLTGKQFSSQNPGIIFMNSGERYPLIKSMVPRINRAMREGKSEETVAEIVLKLAEIELVNLRDAFKNKEKEEKEENDDE